VVNSRDLDGLDIMGENELTQNLSWGTSWDGTYM